MKADGLGAVAGNSNFGDPDAPEQPFGPYFGGGDADGATYDNIGADDFDEKRKRQIQVNVNIYPPTHHYGVDHPDRPDRPHRSRSSYLPSVDVSVNLVSETPSTSPSISTATSSSSTETAISTDITPTSEISATAAEVSSQAVETVSDSVSEFLSLNLTASTISAAEESGQVSESSIESPTETPISAIESTIPTPEATSNFPAPYADPTPFPNLFGPRHPPSAFALTLFSLFGEGHTERADLRPLGPEIGSPATPATLNGAQWVNPPTSVVSMLDRPLGEEVVVDGFDVQVPVDWKGTYQERSFRAFVARLRELNREAWLEEGAVEGGPGDLGADGKSVVYFGWTGDLLRKREDAVTVAREGWVEWDGSY